MAKSKKKTAINKTQAIKDVMAKHPGVGPSEVAKRLQAKGIQVSPAYVSTIKSTLARRKRGASKPKGDGYVAVDALKHAQAFVEQAGGVNKAQEVLDVLASLK